MDLEGLIRTLRQALRACNELKAMAAVMLPKNSKGEPIPSIDSQWAVDYRLAVDTIDALCHHLVQLNPRKVDQNVPYDRRA
jgi:hypothetical protein